MLNEDHEIKNESDFKNRERLLSIYETAPSCCDKKRPFDKIMELKIKGGYKVQIEVLINGGDIKIKAKRWVLKLGQQLKITEGLKVINNPKEGQRRPKAFTGGLEAISTPAICKGANPLICLFSAS
jgi:hypothetical protein